MRRTTKVRTQRPSYKQWKKAAGPELQKLVGRGWSVKKMAEKLGVTPSAVGHWLRPGPAGMRKRHFARLVNLVAGLPDVQMVQPELPLAALEPVQSYGSPFADLAVRLLCKAVAGSPSVLHAVTELAYTGKPLEGLDLTTKAGRECRLQELCRAKHDINDAFKRSGLDHEVGAGLMCLR